MTITVSILIFISRIITTSESFKARKAFIFPYFCFYKQLHFHAQFYNLRAWSDSLNQISLLLKWHIHRGVGSCFVFCLIWFFTSQSTIFQLCRGGSSWVESVFFLFVWFDSLRPINNLLVIKGQVFLGRTSSKLGLMFLLKDTTQWRWWGWNLKPLVSSQALYNWATALPGLNQY